MGWNTESLENGDESRIANFLYYVSRLYADRTDVAEKIRKHQAKREEKIGITRISDPHCLDVEAQVIELSQSAASMARPAASTSSAMRTGR